MATATAAAAIAAPQPNRGLHIALWISQGLLALAFLMAGGMKVATPFADMLAKAPDMASLNAPLVKFIGISELLGAIGLILPALTRVKPILTAIAAAALAVVMVLAAGFHVMVHDYKGLPAVAVLFGLAAFVAWGRFKKAPIAPRA